MSDDLTLRLAASVAVERFKRGDQAGAREALADYLGADDKALFLILERAPMLRAFLWGAFCENQ